MTASYPMYAMPQTRNDLNKWWQHFLNQLREYQVDYGQKLINVDIDLYRHWLDPDLFFSQTCGYPLTAVLKQKVKLIGTPVYDSRYSREANYCSLFIVRNTDTGHSIQDYAGKRFAFNGLDSQSGFNAVKHYLAERSLPLPFFGRNIVSGKHINSIEKVANDEADICAVDSVSYSLMQRHQPELLSNVRVLTSTRLTPGLPFITSIDTSDETVEAIYAAIQQTCADEALRDVNSNLMIKGISKVSLDTYMQSIDPGTLQIDKL